MINPKADRCFPPLTSARAHTLILGSLPGQKSLELQQYYAHPQNAFWRILGAVLEADFTVPYEKRAAILEQHGIAVWDVLAAAERPGSLDSDIVQPSAVANDFVAFFHAHPRIRRVFFNGRKAEEMFRKFAAPKLREEFAHLEFHALPSTSPAHAGLGFAAKLRQWRAVRVDPRIL
jgi:TDG/mug DNA glycosylase family protein